MANVRSKGRKNFRNQRTSNKPNSRSADKIEDKFDRTKERSKSPNDWSWYVRAPQLVKDVASISFNNALGAGFTVNEDQILNTGLVKGATMRMPGIMGIYTIPTPGFSTTPSSPINIAAKNIYVWVRHQNSGHANYDSPDLMMYLIAMDSLYAWIAHCQRIYGIARVYSQRNRYIGDALLRMCGVDPTDLRSNLANFRAAINMVIVKASAFCTPRVMTLYDRHMWMYSGIYQDAPIDKAQFYMYLPSVVYVYNETTAGGGRCNATPTLVAPNGDRLGRVALRGSNWFISMANTMLSALQGSEDINIMSGDILKAYGRENLNTLSFVPEDYAVTPIYSEEILDQIHNTVFVGRYPRVTPMTADNYNVASLSTFDIYQAADGDLDPYIVINPSVLHAPHLSIQHLLDMGENDPTPERVIVATRNMAGGATTAVKPLADQDAMLLTKVNSFGSDLCLYAAVCSDPSSNTIAGYYMESDDGSLIPKGMPLELVKFHKAPLNYSGFMDNGVWNLSAIMGDTDNFTVVSAEDIREMHESAILSQFGVPV